VTRRQHLHEVLRYGIVGAFNAATYFGLYTAGVLIGIPYTIALVLAFVISATWGYLLHEHWTFGGANPTAAGWTKWLTTQGTTVALNLGLLALLVDVFGVDAILAQLLLMPLMPIITFLVARRWVFTRAPTDVRTSG
jgi:putative flippase GtrA